MIIKIVKLCRYSYSAYSITKVIETAEIEQAASEPAASRVKNSKAVKESLILIRQGATYFVVLILVWIICMLIGSIEYQRISKRIWDEDAIVYYMLLFDIGFLFSLAAMCCILRYIYIVSNKGKSTQTSREVGEDNIGTSGVEASSGVVVPVKGADL